MPGWILSGTRNVLLNQLGFDWNRFKTGSPQIVSTVYIELGG